MDSFLAGIEAWARANATPIFLFLGTIVSTYGLLRTKRGDVRSSDRKVDADAAIAARRITTDAEIAAERLRFDRERTSGEQYDRLIAHLDRQLEISRQEAKRERDEMRVEIKTQTREIRWLTARVEQLTDFIRGKGFSPPDEHPRPPE